VALLVASRIHPEISKPVSGAVQFDTVAQLAVADTFHAATNNILTVTKPSDL
jgi:hypothetical protein